MTRSRPTMLIGTSTQPGAFSEPIVTEMAAYAERPVIMPLSNPTSHSEAQAADLIAWTGGRALIATGSPFPPVTYGGVEYQVAQANNALIFPGLGLGVTVARARRVSDGMLAAAANALAGLSDVTAPGAAVLPPVTSLRAVSAAVAEAVARAALAEGLSEVPARRPGRTGPRGHVGAGLPRGGSHLGRCRGRCARCRCRTATSRPTCGSTRTASLAARPVPGAEPLPGRYVAPGLVDAHAHPAVAPGPAARDGAQTLDRTGRVGGGRGHPGPRHRVPGRVRARTWALAPGCRGCRPPGGSSPRPGAISRRCFPRGFRSSG